MTKEMLNLNLSQESSYFFGVFPVEAKHSVPMNYWEIAFCVMSDKKTSVHSLSETPCTVQTVFKDA